MTILVPMSDETYPEYLIEAIAGYARDNVESGRWAEAGALERSRADFESLLPLGPATPDQHLFEVLDAPGGERVGFAWLALERRNGRTTGFVYDLEIKPERRREGHGSRALGALESVAADKGATSVGLHVFAFNAAARALYVRSGYVVSSLNMRKALREG